MQIAMMQPQVATIFTTGYTAETEQLGAMVEKGASILQKPYSPKSLSRLIGAMCARKSLEMADQCPDLPDRTGL